MPGDLLVSGGEISRKPPAPICDARTGWRSFVWGHFFNHAREDFGDGFIVVDAGKRGAWPQALKQHRTGRVFVHSHDALTIEGAENFPSVPFVAGLFDH